MYGDIVEKERKYYEKLLKVDRDYRRMTKNFLQAFLGGGLISVFGQILYSIYFNLLDFDKDNSRLLMTLSIILLSGILTGLGIYDKLGQLFKCGFAIPISGFANATVASAIDYHKEGIILGVGANALKLAGSVIVLGVTSAIIVASIRFLIGVIL